MPKTPARAYPNEWPSTQRPMPHSRTSMPPTTTTDPALAHFREALGELYGDRLDRVVLFGSRARGDAHADSDYDVAVFLNDFDDRWTEVDRLVPVVTDIL